MKILLLNNFVDSVEQSNVFINPVPKTPDCSFTTQGLERETKDDH